MVRTPRTRYALTDTVTPISGLFRAVEKGKKRLEASQVHFSHDGVDHTYTLAFRLGPEEWRLLIACCALAGLDGDRFNSGTMDSRQLTLWDHFLTEAHAKRRDGLNFRTTAYALLREVGVQDSGQNRRILSDQLERLSMVFETMRKGGKVMSGSRLLGYAHDEESGELSIGLSPHMARAILGEAKQYTRISLVEVRALDRDIAVLLHAYFSSRIRAGKDARFPLDTLVGVVYGEDEVPAKTKEKRRLRVREALLTFNKLTTWRVGLDSRRRGRSTEWLVNVERITLAQLEEWEKAHVSEFQQYLTHHPEGD